MCLTQKKFREEFFHPKTVGLFAGCCVFSFPGGKKRAHCAPKLPKTGKTALSGEKRPKCAPLQVGAGEGTRSCAFQPGKTALAAHMQGRTRQIGPFFPARSPRNAHRARISPGPQRSSCRCPSERRRERPKGVNENSHSRTKQRAALWRVREVRKSEALAFGPCRTIEGLPCRQNAAQRHSG